MDKANVKLTVYFEEPFWVGIFERIEDGNVSVAKVTFGAEPKRLWSTGIYSKILFQFEIQSGC